MLRCNAPRLAYMNACCGSLPVCDVENITCLLACRSVTCIAQPSLGISPVCESLLIRGSICGHISFGYVDATDLQSSVEKGNFPHPPPGFRAPQIHTVTSKTVLHVAAASSKLKAVAYLLEKGSEVDAQDDVRLPWPALASSCLGECACSSELGGSRPAPTGRQHAAVSRRSCR